MKNGVSHIMLYEEKMQNLGFEFINYFSSVFFKGWYYLAMLLGLFKTGTCGILQK